MKFKGFSCVQEVLCRFFCSIWGDFEKDYESFKDRNGMRPTAVCGGILGDFVSDYESFKEGITAAHCQLHINRRWAVGLKQWDVLRQLPSQQQDEVRSFVVFWSGLSAFYITRKDEVLGIGNNGVNLNLLGLTGPNYRKERVDQPVEIKSLSNKSIVAISLGVYVGAALDNEGWLYWWGCVCENYGEIRTPHLASDSPRFSSISCGAMFVATLSNDGWVYVWGRFWNSERYFVEHSLLTGCYVTMLSCGLGHLAMVTSDGQVYTWGDGRDGQRGFSTYRYPDHEDVVRKAEIDLVCSAVKCGGHSTLFLSNAGEVYACGANDATHGYLGVDSSETNVIKPLKVNITEIVTELTAGWQGTLLTTYAALTENGNVYVWGRTAVPTVAASVGTSLVGAYLGQPTPRDTMVQVRPPALVPPVPAETSNETEGPPKRNKYVDVIMTHFPLLEGFR